MIDKIKTILRNKLVLILYHIEKKNILRNRLENILALIPLLGSILIIISLLTPFAISMGVEGISISSQSNVWYWGIYQEQDQVFSLAISYMRKIVYINIITLFFTISIIIFSIEFGLNRLKRKFYGELIFIYIVFIYLSITLNIKLIEYAFSLMPDLELALGSYAPFWSYRLQGFGYFGINIAILLIVAGSIISLIESKKSFFYIEIITFLIWILFTNYSTFFFMYIM